MKKRFKIPLKMKENRHFELFGEEFLVRDMTFHDSSFIIIYTCDRFDLKELSEKFKSSQTFKNINGIIFKTPSKLTLFSFSKNKPSLHFISSVMLKILT